ncbi:MAG: flagellar FliJ family protein [Pseudomonadota bacterium]
MTQARASGAGSLTKLLTLASQREREQVAHIADLETAVASTQSSIEWLDQAVRTEQEAAQSAGDAARQGLAAYLRGADEKRLALHATRDRLGVELSTARDDLAALQIERKKFERLVEIANATARRDQSRRDQARTDEQAARIVQRNQGVAS